MAGRRPFRFGVVAAQASSAEEWLARGRRAEELGYATLVAPDTAGATLSPIPALGVLAGATRTLRLGTYVLANDYRNPVLLARELATLDVLSGGRLEAGMGAGRPGADQDYRRLGIPYEPGRVRVDRLAESLRLVKALLAGETADATGAHYSAAGAVVYPKPPRRPPVLVAASGPRLLALAAREADIVALGAMPGEGEAGLRRRIETLREAAPERFPDLELNMNLLAVGETVHPMVAARFGIEPEALARSGSPMVVLGTPERMAEQLQRTREVLGISYVLLPDAFMEAFAPVVERLAGR